MRRIASLTIFVFVFISYFGFCPCLAEDIQPEFECVIKGVKFSVYPGAGQAAINSGVKINLDSGILFTPTGKVRWHDLTKNGVSQVGLVKNKMGKLVILAVWPNGTVVFMLCMNEICHIY